MHSRIIGLGFTLAATVVDAATVEVFTDRGQFEARLTSSTSQDFEGLVLPRGLLPGDPMTLDALTFSAVDPAPDGRSWTVAVIGKNWNYQLSKSAHLITYAAEPIEITWAGTPPGANAFGASFGDMGSSAVAGTVSVFGASGLLASVAVTNSSMSIFDPLAFVGFVVTGDEILRLVYASDGYEAVDNVVYGVAPVPLPAAGSLFAGGLAVLWSMRRRARALA